MDKTLNWWRGQSRA